ncbi:hypothetical protein HPB52_021928 [Rhipicephalus sanguineus]|uniref:Uncharacterized protein n=1 Tax=Rhipicephalus sanguineus TaxID=34632 RepID=A0A9D4T6U3_RHISA|nr:hypothetical protein HPB52_021928 [Rhipicephalus sanguineus]
MALDEHPQRFCTEPRECFSQASRPNPRGMGHAKPREPRCLRAPTILRSFITEHHGKTKQRADTLRYAKKEKNVNAGRRCAQPNTTAREVYKETGRASFFASAMGGASRMVRPRAASRLDAGLRGPVQPNGRSIPKLAPHVTVATGTVTVKRCTATGKKREILAVDVSPHVVGNHVRQNFEGGHGLRDDVMFWERTTNRVHWRSTTNVLRDRLREADSCLGVTRFVGTEDAQKLPAALTAQHTRERSYELKLRDSSTTTRIGQALDENEAAILHTRLTSWHNELNTVNDEIEPLVTDEDAENEFQQTCEYKDRVVACLARLQRRMTVTSLRRLYDTLAAHICGLESLGRKLHTYGAMLLPVVQRAMPRDILLDFGRKCATDANSTFDDQRSSSTEGPEPTTPEGDREFGLKAALEGDSQSEAKIELKNAWHNCPIVGNVASERDTAGLLLLWKERACNDKLRCRKSTRREKTASAIVRAMFQVHEARALIECMPCECAMREMPAEACNDHV